jgi:hypothetical protein
MAPSVCFEGQSGYLKSIFESRRLPVSVQDMLRSHPSPAAQDESIVRCIEETFACAQACTVCADACLAEDDVSELRRCIGLNLDCADVCETTARVLSRATSSDLELTRSVLLACVQACRSCGAECKRHAEHHEHCRVCAESCRRCEEVCEETVAALTSRAG